MTKEAFEQEILCHLREQLERYPCMEPQDLVKFVFQAMLGVGHLLSSRDAVENYVIRETEQLSPGEPEPLVEMLSPAWCRLSLRGAKEKGISPSIIAGLMLSSEKASCPFTRRDVADFCAGLAASGEMPAADPDLLKQIMDETWLPSHSQIYREKYRPAYRIVSAEWIPCMELIQRIAGKQGMAERMLITIDGPCASGKTTLAEKLAGVFGAHVVHTDDYVIPHAQKTPERLAVPGGNCDADRLVDEVVAPWKRSDTVMFRKYDCRNDRLLPVEKLPEGRMLILEGSYCNLPAIRQYADVRVFINTPWEKRIERLQKRESARSLQMFYDRWIPLEDRYFEAYGLPDRECVVLNG